MRRWHGWRQARPRWSLTAWSSTRDGISLKFRAAYSRARPRRWASIDRWSVGGCDRHRARQMRSCSTTQVPFSGTASSRITSPGRSSPTCALPVRLTRRVRHVTRRCRCSSAPSAAAFVLPGNRVRLVASCRNGRPSRSSSPKATSRWLIANDGRRSPYPIRMSVCAGMLNCSGSSRSAVTDADMLSTSTEKNSAAEPARFPTATQGVAGSLGLGPVAEHRVGEGSGEGSREGGRGMSGKHSVWKRRPDGKAVRRNKISGQFAHQLIEMLESPAWRVLSLSARRVFDRIQIEHAHHGGRENGRLPVTFKDFEEFGLDRHSIRPAIAELDALGFIRITQHGRGWKRRFPDPEQVSSDAPTRQ